MAYEFYQQQISQCDRQIEQYLTRLDFQIELEEIEEVTKQPTTKNSSKSLPSCQQKRLYER